MRQASMGKVEGVVVSFNPIKGFGFIQPAVVPGGGPVQQVYFNIKQYRFGGCSGEFSMPRVPDSGDKVRYEQGVRPEQGANGGKPYAREWCYADEKVNAVTTATIVTGGKVPRDRSGCKKKNFANRFGGFVPDFITRTQ